MANKPIINIDINSEPFQRFQKLFEQHQKDVQNTNAEWQAMIANMTNPKIVDYADKIHGGFQKVAVAIGTAGTAMGTLLKGATSASHALEKVTVGIAKVGAAVTAISGVTFFGLDRLAASVFEKGKSAAGMGLSVGQISSFGVNMSPMLNSPEGLLGAAANAQVDVNKWGALAGMGIDPGAAAAMSPFDLAMQLQTKARSMWQKSHNLQMMEAFGVTQFFSPEDLRRMGAMSDKDFAATQARTRSGVNAMNWDTATTKTWTDLKIRIDAAGNEIEKILVTGLGRLAGPLEKLSETAVHLVDAFSRSPEVKAAIDALTRGISAFADHLLPNQYSTPIGPQLPGAKGAPQNGTAGTGDYWFDSVLQNLLGPRVWWPGIHDDDAQTITRRWFFDKTAFKTIEGANGLPPGLLKAVYGAESSGGRNLVSPKGALGPFQFMPGTAKQYGVDNPFDLMQSAGGAGRKLHDLLRMFGGDPDKALAGWNWGEGNLKRDIAKWGDRWRQHLPNETSDFLARVHGSGGGGSLETLMRQQLRAMNRIANKMGDAKVSINNETSARVAVQLNGAAI